MKLKKLAASLLAAAMLFCGTATTAFADGGCDGGWDDDLGDILEGIEIGIPGIDIDDIDDIDIDVEKTWKGGEAEGEIQLPNPGDVKVKVKYGKDEWVSVDVDWDDPATVIKDTYVTWRGEIDLEDIIKAIIADIKNNIISSGGKAIQANGGFDWGDDLKEELKTILKQVITALTKSDTNIFDEEITGNDADQWSLKSKTFKLLDDKLKLDPTLKLTNTYIGDNGDGGDKEEEEDTVSITVNKVWKGDENYLNARPEKITVRLLADNKVVEGKTLTLSADNNWTGTFLELKKYRTDENNNVKVDEHNQPIEIKYTVEEVNVPTGYTVSYDYGRNDDGTREYDRVVFGDDNQGSVTITNTYKGGDEEYPDTVNVSFTKYFKLINATADDVKGHEFTFTLTPLRVELRETREGNLIKSNTVYYNANGVTVTFEDVPEGIYTLEENMPEGWTNNMPEKGVIVVVERGAVSFYNRDNDGGKEIDNFSVTNTYKKTDSTPIDRDDEEEEEKDESDLTVKKVDSKTGKLITEKATFRIYKLSGSRKLYYTGSSWSSNVEKAKEYSTKNGKFTAYDLGAGTYYVEEVKAPSGYNLADDLKVKLTSKDKTVEFANSKAKQNPNTGALVLPVDLADAAVAAMTLGAAAWVISKSKK